MLDYHIDLLFFIASGQFTVPHDIFFERIYFQPSTPKRLPISLWITKNTKASLICVKIKIHPIIYLHIVI
ncbi:MAG TPA: hypothetical protein DD441_15335 [Parabacteroides distasonis]|nr:hypothetical protein [Parabacteroides distasonis]